MQSTDRQTSKHVRDPRDAEYVARAAWLHFVGGLTQSEVARRLNVPTTRAHRYIARAQSEGLVRVFVDVSSAECVALETQLMDRFGLDFCRIAMDVPEAGALPLRALSAIGGDYLMQAVTSRNHDVIGIGHGRTIAAAVDAMGRIDGTGLRFVSLLGGLTRSYSANPYDVIHRLAYKTAADAYLMPAPLYANTPHDREVLLAQTGIAATIRMMDEASLIIAGIGQIESTGEAASVVSLGGPEAVATLYKAGARAEILGQFIDRNGQILATAHDARVMAAPLESLRKKYVVAIAGGAEKTSAIGAALRSGLLTGLIIDEGTARALVETDKPGIRLAVQ